MRIRRPDAKRRTRRHGVWVHDLFSFRGIPAAWKEELWWVSESKARPPTDAQHHVRHLSDPVVVTLSGYDGISMLEVAADGATRLALLGPPLQPHDIE